jgi:Ubiquitin-specific protease C-terminal
MNYLNQQPCFGSSSANHLPYFPILQQVQNFGEPFLLVIHEGETLAEVKKRIQKKLQVQDEEFAKVLSFFLLSITRPINEKY